MYYPTVIEFDITQEDIDLAFRAISEGFDRACSCPLSQALRRTGYQDVATGKVYFRLFTEEIVLYNLNDTGQLFVWRFDMDRPTVPTAGIVGIRQQKEAL